LAAFISPARAQWVVIDPANLLQTTLTALRALQQLTNEAQMLENEAKNLKSLNFSSLSQLQATLATKQSRVRGWKHKLLYVVRGPRRSHVHAPSVTAALGVIANRLIWARPIARMISLEIL
jgi:hypothetical protein